MGFLSFLRRQTAVSAAVTVPSGKRKKVTVRVPEELLLAVKEKCFKSDITLNEATNLLYTWLNNEFIEFEIVRRVRRRQSGGGD